MRKVEKISEILNIDVNAASLVKPPKEVSISVYFSYLEAKRKSWSPRSPEVQYLLSIFIGEALGREKGEAFVPFIIEAETEPDLVSFTLRGGVYIEGSLENIEDWVLPQGEKAPKVWMRIYQESLAMLAILARFVDAPPPEVSSLNE